MEASRKRRGFIKAKLPLSFNRGPKSSSTMQYSSKVNPSRSSPTPSVGFLVNEELSFPQLKQKASFMKLDANADPARGATADHNGDDSVDKKAASYISYVQERFKLERVNSDRRHLEEIKATGMY